MQNFRIHNIMKILHVKFNKKCIKQHQNKHSDYKYNNFLTNKHSYLKETYSAESVRAYILLS